MQCIHKRFCVQRTVFLFLFLTFASVSCAYAQNSLFTVEGVTVDITSSSAVAAREEAFEKAQADAFTTLQGRLLSGDQDVSIPEVDVISTMIKDYEISNEQLSTVRYMATYKFRFNEDAVRQYFNASDMSYTDVGANPALVLPFYMRNDQMILWSPYNVWMSGWNRADNLDGLVPLIVPLGDIADVSDIGDEDALDYSNSRLNRLLQRYGASEAVILIATPDDMLSRVQGEGDAAASALNIRIYRTDRGYPEQVEGLEVSAGRSDTLASLMDKAVREVQRTLRADWKRKTVTASSMGVQSLRARVPYSSLKEWAETQRALTRVNGLNSFKVMSVTPHQAYVELEYDGNQNRLALALAQADLQLNQTRAPHSMARGVDDSMSYYSGGAGAGASDQAAYDLYLRRYHR